MNPVGFGGICTGFSFIEPDIPKPVRLMQLVEERDTKGSGNHAEAWCIAGALCATSLFVFMCG